MWRCLAVCGGDRLQGSQQHGQSAHAADLSPDRLRTAASISSRRKIQRRPSLCPGSSPRRAYSSTVETGRCSSSATSRPSRTSSRVSRGWVGMDAGMVLIDMRAEEWLVGLTDPKLLRPANEFGDSRSRPERQPPLSCGSPRAGDRTGSSAAGQRPPHHGLQRATPERLNGLASLPSGQAQTRCTAVP